MFDDIFGHAPSGEPVGLLRLSNDQLRVGLTNYGARMLSIETPGVSIMCCSASTAPT